MGHPVVPPASTSATGRLLARARELWPTARRLLARAGWLTAIVLTACGSAGILAAIDHSPGTPGRAELTWARDSVVTPALDQAQQDLVALSLEVDQLNLQARKVLVALTDRSNTDLDAAVAAGSALEAVIDAEAQALRVRLQGLVSRDPHPELQVSVAQLTRRDVVSDALDTTRGLHDAWSRLTAGAAATSRLTGLLTAHDTTMAQAAAQGRAQAYADALVTIATARMMLDEATRLRDQIANVSDVSTLDQWIRRNRTYDEALETLYAAFRASGGKVTAGTAAAIKGEAAARAQLPPDTRGLIVIVSEIAQGGLNQAAAAIAQSGRQLAHALDALP